MSDQQQVITKDQLKQKFAGVLKKLDLDTKKTKIKELETLSLQPNFWQDHIKAGKIMQELAELQKEVEEVEFLALQLEENLSTEELYGFDRQIKQLENKVFLSGKFDKAGAILSIHAGQGGTEACDWSQMLYRMYFKYAQKKGWQVKIIDEHTGEEAGIKSVVLEINGRWAYGLLKNEKGTHRLVRLSPFNADNLRQTSFSLVEVIPIIEEENAVAIKNDDVVFESTRSSGHGGQNVNKVSTAVRITHKPTGIIVECQSQRYQEQNRKIAMQILRGKLWELQEAERLKNLKTIKGEHKIAGWGNQIRSYVLHPYKLVKDLRTKYEETNPEAVLGGELEGFIQTGLRNL